MNLMGAYVKVKAKREELDSLLVQYSAVLSLDGNSEEAWKLKDRLDGTLDELQSLCYELGGRMENG